MDERNAMTPAKKPNWRTAAIPDNTMFIAIGDVHGQTTMLDTLIKGIEQRIAALPEGVQTKIIFEGDYIDRGENTPDTIERLIKFKEAMRNKPNVEVVMMAGNHDEIWGRWARASNIVMESQGNRTNLRDQRHMLSDTSGAISLAGFMNMFGSGGGITTVRDYTGMSEDELLVFQSTAAKVVNDWMKGIENPQQAHILAQANAMLKKVQEKMPESHKQFLEEVNKTTFYELGDYLFTHAGVQPRKSLEEQGLRGNQPLSDLERIERVEIPNRNEFQWREDLPNCDKVVVHGHTPSAIKENIAPGEKTMVIADCQKPFRLCLDTDVYGKNGALTAMVRSNINGANNMNFMAVATSSPTQLVPYSLNAQAAERAQAQHTHENPQYHPGGDQYYGHCKTVEEETMMGVRQSGWAFRVQNTPTQSMAATR